MRRLLIRPGAIGDCILCFPALQFLRASYTEIWVPLPVVPLLNFADRVCPLSSTGLDLVGLGDLPLDPTLRKRLQSFDQIVSWYGTNREEFRSAIRSLGIPCYFHAALPPPTGTVPAVDFFCTQVGAPAGAIPTVVVRTKVLPRETIVIHPFSGSSQKNWPLSCFRELATRLSASVEWLAGPDEELTKSHRFPSLQDLAQWLSGARLYLGNDSGITHLAAAVGTPVISLFRTTSPAVWSPRGRDVTVLQQDGLTVASLAQRIEARLQTQ